MFVATMHDYRILIGLCLGYRAFPLTDSIATDAIIPFICTHACKLWIDEFKEGWVVGYNDGRNEAL
jgi:hypothetical protein